MSITLNPYLMALVFVVFMVLIYLLNAWLFKPMFAFMASREDSIAKDVATTQSYKEHIAKIEQDIAQTLSKARKESADIIENATKEAKIAYENQMNEKKSENEAKFAKAKKELQTQKDALYTALLADLPVFQNALSHKLKQL